MSYYKLPEIYIYMYVYKELYEIYGPMKTKKKKDVDTLRKKILSVFIHTSRIEKKITFLFMLRFFFLVIYYTCHCHCYGVRFLRLFIREYIFLY